MLTFLTLSAIGALLVPLDIGTRALVGWLLGVQITNLHFFAGPRLWRGKVARVTVPIGALPFFGSVSRLLP